MVEKNFLVDDIFNVNSSKNQWIAPNTVQSITIKEAEIKISAKKKIRKSAIQT